MQKLLRFTPALTSSFLKVVPSHPACLVRCTIHRVSFLPRTDVNITDYVVRGRELTGYLTEPILSQSHTMPTSP